MGLLPKPINVINQHMQIIQNARLRSCQFAPGQSGNPGGRPKDDHQVAELVCPYMLEVMDTLVELMRDGSSECVRGTVGSSAPRPRVEQRAKVEVVTGAEGSYLDVLGVVSESILSKRSSGSGFIPLLHTLVKGEHIKDPPKKQYNKAGYPKISKQH